MYRKYYILIMQNKNLTNKIIDYKIYANKL